jgi:hypothetical protein
VALEERGEAGGRAAACAPAETGGQPLIGDVVFTFETTHQAMAAEDILREAGFRLEVVPPPRGLTAGCGLALQLSERDVPAATETLERTSAKWAAIHRLCADGKVLRIAGARSNQEGSSHLTG